MKILVIGNNTRSIVCSAKIAGHTVFGIDNFCDVDMRLCADSAFLLEYATDSRIYELARGFGEIDGVILGTGFERLKFKNVLGNRIEVSEAMNDKLRLTDKLQNLGIPHPRTELLPEAGGLKFPLMIKPRCGSGGTQNRIVNDDNELAAIQSRPDAREFIAQEFVQGIPCSTSIIGTGDEATVIALNEQLIGMPDLTGLPFAYCGNITPFITHYNKEMIEYSEQMALEFGLMGSNGVDFIQTENGIVVIEVNPRFQGSLDTIERSYDINLFEAHMRSFSGDLPEPGKYRRFAIKNILFASKSITVNKRSFLRLFECMKMERAADIPEEGRVVMENEPLTTLFEVGNTREIVKRKIRKSVQYIKGLTEA